MDSDQFTIQMDKIKRLRQTRAEMQGAIEQIDALGREIYLTTQQPGDPCKGTCWYTPRCPHNPVCTE